MLYELLQELNKYKLDNKTNYDEKVINSRYLLPDMKINKWENIKNDNEIGIIVNNFMNLNDNKSLNIKSPYDTGKTLLKQIIENYNVPKILFISYRKTLTYDIRSKFDDLQFKSYLDEDLNSDRLII